MGKLIQKICLILLGLGLTTTTTTGKVWLLPDYQSRQLFSHRTNGGTTNHPTEDISCSNYNMLSSTQIETGMICKTSAMIKDIKCFGDCGCATSYQYPSSTCHSEGKIPSGSSCQGKYQECICDTSIYPHTSSSCAHTLSGSPCLDKSGEHYPNCINPCAPYADYADTANCPYDCETPAPNCLSKCQKCYNDNCHIREDKNTTLGCEKYWSDCATKCEQGKTCVPQDCSAYPLTSCRSSYYTCSQCKSCDGIVRYKATACKAYNITDIENAVSDRCQTISLYEPLDLGGATINLDNSALEIARLWDRPNGVKNGTIVLNENGKIYIDSSLMAMNLSSLVIKTNNTKTAIVTSGYINNLDNISIQGSGETAIRLNVSHQPMINFENIIVEGDYQAQAITIIGTASSYTELSGQDTYYLNVDNIKIRSNGAHGLYFYHSADDGLPENSKTSLSLKNINIQGLYQDAAMYLSILTSNLKTGYKLLSGDIYIDSPDATAIYGGNMAWPIEIENANLTIANSQIGIGGVTAMSFYNTQADITATDVTLYIKQGKRLDIENSNLRLRGKSGLYRQNTPIYIKDSELKIEVSDYVFRGIYNTTTQGEIVLDNSTIYSNSNYHGEVGVNPATGYYEDAYAAYTIKPGSKYMTPDGIYLCHTQGKPQFKDIWEPYGMTLISFPESNFTRIGDYDSSLLN